MSSYKTVQMILRGFVVFLMAIGLFLNSETQYLTRVTVFIQTGVFGSCLVVSAGLMIEAGLQVNYRNEDYVASFVVITGIFLNLIAGVCAFYEFSGELITTSPENKVNKGCIAGLAVGLYMIDVCLIFSKVL